MIRQILLVLVLGVFITACTTTPEQSQEPEVVEGVDTDAAADDAAADTDGEAQTFGADADQDAIMQQLEDPESLLSVRIIYFDYDSSAVQAQFEEIIQAHATFLQANPGVTASLEGHADERGSREYNLALGERRAQAIKQQMVVLGAAPEQLRTVSYGEERPADPGHDEQAWELNRRVEIVY